MATTLVFLADGHSGSHLGLMSPNVVLLDEDEHGEIKEWRPAQRPFQKWCWEVFLCSVERVREFAGKDRIVVIYDGDACWGNRYGDNAITTREADQVAIAAQSIAPLLALPGVCAYKQIIGTQAHNYGGTAEVMLARQIASAFPNISVSWHNHLLLNVDGVEVDVAHHGPSGGARLWLHGNVLRYGLRDIMLSDILEGRTPPRVVVRAHYHVYRHVSENVIVGDKEYSSDAIILPCLCGMTHYARQVSRSAWHLGVGIVAVRIDGGNINILPIWKNIDIRTREDV